MSVVRGLTPDEATTASPLDSAACAALRTHARTIVEGEGADEHDPALVEAVAQDLWGWDMQTQMLRTWDNETPGFRKQYEMRALSLLSTIRKHVENGR